MSLIPYHHKQSHTSFPRSRGDEPAKRLQVQGEAVFSPLTRG